MAGWLSVWGRAEGVGWRAEQGATLFLQASTHAERLARGGPTLTVPSPPVLHILGAFCSEAGPRSFMFATHPVGRASLLCRLWSQGCQASLPSLRLLGWQYSCHSLWAGETLFTPQLHSPMLPRADRGSCPFGPAKPRMAEISSSCKQELASQQPVSPLSLSFLSLLQG